MDGDLWSMDLDDWLGDKIINTTTVLKTNGVNHRIFSCQIRCQKRGGGNCPANVTAGKNCAAGTK